jgi:glyoxylase-like metal-dependent hydrolase (beta-lactamase superfamily II)/rhodanese-related sulfurtransferase
MFFRQILHEDLGCASYLVADAGEAAVVDPKWEVDEYLRLAERHRFRISHILETHNHADHVSGRGRLAAATGAAMHVPAAAHAVYPHVPVRDGDAIDAGRARITALGTPGHRPEHMAYLVTDRGRSPEPWLLLSGDSLLVGDVARPDLAVGASDGARDLFRTLRRLLELGDGVELWPGHVGGSLCGGTGMSPKSSSTLGFERRANPPLGASGEEEFIAVLTARPRVPPPHFRRVAELNRGPLVTAPSPIEPLPPRHVSSLMRRGAALVDGRSPAAFDREHVPGSINVTMAGAGVGTRAAWATAPDGMTVVTAQDETDARRFAALLEAVGFRRLVGHLEGGIDGWRAAGLAIGATPTIDVATLARALERNEVVLLDVRESEEWDAGHVAGSIHCPYWGLSSATDGLPRRRPLAVACAHGNRSSLAASLLTRAGVREVFDVSGGGIADLPSHGVELVPDKGNTAVLGEVQNGPAEESDSERRRAALAGQGQT